MMFTAQFLRKVVDTLLPGLPKTEQKKAIPAASEVGIEQMLAKQLHTAHNRPLIAEALAAIVRQSGDEAQFIGMDEAARVIIMQGVEQEHSEAFNALLFTVSADYYESTAVLEAFGWRSTPLQPEGFTLPPFNERLLDGVKSRSKLWRD